MMLETWSSMAATVMGRMLLSPFAQVRASSDLPESHCHSPGIHTQAGHGLPMPESDCCGLPEMVV